jgi:hypothetical protein
VPRFRACISIASVVGTLFSPCQAAPDEITAMFPGLSYGMTVENLNRSLPRRSSDPVQPASTGRSLYRYNVDSITQTQLRYTLMIEKTRLTKFTVQPVRDEDRDKQLSYWFQKLTQQYGAHKKFDDNGSGLGGRSPTLSYVFCASDSYTEIELGRIENISYVTFEPISNRVRPTCTQQIPTASVAPPSPAPATIQAEVFSSQSCMAKVNARIKPNLTSEEHERNSWEATKCGTRGRYDGYCRDSLRQQRDPPFPLDKIDKACNCSNSALEQSLTDDEWRGLAYMKDKDAMRRAHEKMGPLVKICMASAIN